MLGRAENHVKAIRDIFSGCDNAPDVLFPRCSSGRTRRQIGSDSYSSTYICRLQICRVPGTTYHLLPNTAGKLVDRLSNAVAFIEPQKNGYTFHKESFECKCKFLLFLTQDIYVITCLVLQSIFLVQNSVAAIVSDGRKFDLYSGMALAAAVILFHIIFILIVAMKVCDY